MNHKGWDGGRGGGGIMLNEPERLGWGGGWGE